METLQPGGFEIIRIALWLIIEARVRWASFKAARGLIISPTFTSLIKPGCRQSPKEWQWVDGDHAEATLPT